MNLSFFKNKKNAHHEHSIFLAGEEGFAELPCPPVALAKEDHQFHAQTKSMPPIKSSILLAGEEGFEPPNAGTKTRCLTTWRLPKALEYFNLFMHFFQDYIFHLKVFILASKYFKIYL